MNSQFTISSKAISVIVHPKNAGTISHIGRTQSPESNVLAWYEWNDIKPVPFEATEGESHVNWLSRYRGGWQFLTPNAGGQCTHSGRVHPFHGDSSNGPWRVTESASDKLTMEITCTQSLQVTRKLSLHANKPILSIATTIQNITAHRQEIVLVEHAAFQGSSTGLVSAPPESHWSMAPGYEEEGVTSLIWREAGRNKPDLRNPLQRGDKTERMVYLDKGNEGWVHFTDSGRGVGAKLLWDKDVFPYLWYWQERNSPAAPFNGRAEMTALEPASCLPGDTLAGASGAKRSTFIEPWARYSFSVEVESD